MKFPSLSRMPRHKRFNFEPRYYDPIKEDIKNRIERIKGEIDDVSRQNYREHIKSAYESKMSRSHSGSVSQLILIVIMLGAFFGFIYYGNIALYVFLCVFAVYVFLKIRKVIR